MNPAESPGYPTSLLDTNFGSAVKPYGFTSGVSGELPPLNIITNVHYIFNGGVCIHMPSIKEQFWINGEPSEVFEELATPQVWQTVLLESPDAGSGDFPVDYSHRLGKQQLSLIDESEEQVVLEDTGAFDATYTFQVEPQGTGTRVNFDTDYTVTIPLVKRIAGGLVKRYITGQLEDMLEQLQAELRTREGTVDTAAAAEA